MCWLFHKRIFCFPKQMENYILFFMAYSRSATNNSWLNVCISINFLMFPKKYFCSVQVSKQDKKEAGEKNSLEN